VSAVVTFGDVTINENHTDLDSHANQCVVGDNTLIVHDYDKPVTVRGFDPNGPVSSPLRTVSSAALAYDDSRTGEPVILVVHQAIYAPQMQHNLLSCMQLRLNDVTVNEVPKFLTENPMLNNLNNADPVLKKLNNDDPIWNILNADDPMLNNLNDVDPY
jgi:hypothetical protein